MDMSTPQSNIHSKTATEASDTGERTLHLKDSVNPESALVLVNQTLSFHASDSYMPIHLQIFSPGGCVVSGLAIIDVMQHVEAPVFTYAIGCAASMGAVILACGERQTPEMKNSFAVRMDLLKTLEENSHFPSTIQPSNPDLIS
jgi:ATP-dependent Clp endopeptidase proteolytic subunit ClpP